MSADVIMRAFGLEGHVLSAVDETDTGGLLLRVRPVKDDRVCPVCGSSNVIGRGTHDRVFRTVPLGGSRAGVSIALPRRECRDCGIVSQSRAAFADERKSYTRSFARYALELCRQMTVLDVAHHLGATWDLIKEIHKNHLAEKFARPALRHITRICIDEICVGRGHKYLTVVLDFESGVIVFVGDGKGADALKPFWPRLKRSRAKIAAAAIDMSPAYIEAVTNNLPDAAVVFDRFHIVKLFNDKLSDLRRDLYREASDKLKKAVLKGTRWLLLKNPENLNEKRNERARLEEALQLNRPLAIAYYMKEKLRRLWDHETKETANRALDDWMRLADASGVKMLQKFAKTLASHRSGILARYDHFISNGPLEGTNNKIKTMTRQAYGLRDQVYFRLRLLGLHETRRVTVG